jgi:hypothetical protein
MPQEYVIENIGELPQDYCIIYDFAFEYKMHTNGIIISTYIKNNTKQV